MRTDMTLRARGSARTQGRAHMSLALHPTFQREEVRGKRKNVGLRKNANVAEEIAHRGKSYHMTAENILS